MEWITKLSMLFFLAVNSYTDIKYKKLSIAVSVVFVLIGIILEFLLIKSSFISILGGIGIGFILIIVSKLSRYSIGLGDGMIFMVSGVYIGFVNNISLLLYGLLICAVASIVLIALKRKKLKDKIPFAPFILGAYLIILIMEV